MLKSYQPAKMFLTTSFLSKTLVTKAVLITVVITTIIIALGASPVAAHSSNQAASISAKEVDLRIEIFDEIDLLFKALRFEIVNRHSTDQAATLEFSTPLLNLGYQLEELFSAPSARDAFPQSRSRPTIWRNKERFDSLMGGFVDNLEQIDDAIQAGDFTQAATTLDQTAKGCRQCHNSFRYR